MDKILAAIDEEIARLRQVRSLLSQTKTSQTGKKRGRPKKRTMSAEARARIAAAQRKRWAKQKKSKVPF